GALPLPPPPSDYKVSMYTPTAVREATGNIPTISPSEDGKSEERLQEPAVVGAQSLAASIAGVTTSTVDASLPSGGSMSMGSVPVEGARLKATGALATIRKWIDINAVRYLWQAARETYRNRNEIARVRKLIVTEQGRLDGLLATLGREARAADLGLPAL